MDIIIKSFNRPYYLDRCILSILKNVKGDFKIKIVDDGTPKKYLERIKEKHQVEIIPTINYLQKSKNIEEGKENNGFVIPTESWRKAVEEASDYFLITEDDVWFTNQINCNELITRMNGLLPKPPEVLINSTFDVLKKAGLFSELIVKYGYSEKLVILEQTLGKYREAYDDVFLRLDSSINE